MNKLFIILLAIGLATAHTFVKRDAPAGASTESIIESAKQHIEKFGGEVQKVFDPENIKKEFNEFVDKVKDLTDNLKPKEKKQ